MKGWGTALVWRNLPLLLRLPELEIRTRNHTLWKRKCKKKWLGALTKKAFFWKKKTSIWNILSYFISIWLILFLRYLRILKLEVTEFLGIHIRFVIRVWENLLGNQICYNHLLLSSCSTTYTKNSQTQSTLNDIPSEKNKNTSRAEFIFTINIFFIIITHRCLRN